MTKATYTIQDVYDLAEEVSEVLDGRRVNLCIAALLTTIAGIAEQCSDDDAEFRATIARIAGDLTEGCDRPPSDSNYAH